MVSLDERLLFEFRRSLSRRRFAWRASDRVRLRNAIAEIRADPDMNIWVNLEKVRVAEKFAESNR